jgi:hypothetical protein
MLGRGGMGIVYRAEHRDNGCVAAVKTVRVPSQGMLASIRREVHALSRIRHPGIVRILDEGLDSGLPWYAMELLEGRTLRRFLRAGHVDLSTVSQLDAFGPTEATVRSGVRAGGPSNFGPHRTISARCLAFTVLKAGSAERLVKRGALPSRRGRPTAGAP